METSLRMLIILFFFGTLTAEELKLQFKTGSPVVWNYESLVESQVKTDETTFSSVAKETIRMEVAVLGSDELAKEIPLDIETILMNYTTVIEAEGKKLSFDLNDPGTHFPFSELSLLKSKPLKIKLENPVKGFELIVQKNHTDDLIQDKFAKLGVLLFARLREWFFLTSQPLDKGKKIVIDLEADSDLPLKSTLTYEITEITPLEIKAHVAYKVDRQKILGDFPATSSVKEKSTLVTHTNLTGDAVWNRQNALIFNLQMKGVYSSALKKGEVTQSTEMKVSFRQATEE